MKIPLLSVPDEPLSSSTQNHIPIADITDDLVLYKNGAVTLIMESTSLNFGLLSEVEQEAVIAGYAALLNSLTFHIQIVVRSQQKDISGYILNLEKIQSEFQENKLAHILEGYKNFIAESIKKKNVLSKRFFIVIPFTQYELGMTKSLTSSLKRSSEEQTLPYTRSYILRKAKIALFPKREHIARQARRLGLQLKQLNTEELIKLNYNLYNPEPPIKDLSYLQSLGQA